MRKLVGKLWFCSYKVWKNWGSLARNARFEVPTCLGSILWFSCPVAVSTGEAAKPLIFKGVQTGSMSFCVAGVARRDILMCQQNDVESRFVWQTQCFCVVFRKWVLHMSWQAKHFERVRLHVAWQAQHFRRVVLRVFWWIALSGLSEVVTTLTLRAWQARDIVRVSFYVAGAVFGAGPFCAWNVILRGRRSISDTLHFTLRTLLSTPDTPHSSHFTLIYHLTFQTLHFTLHTVHSTLYTLHFTLHTLHFTFYTLHSTLYTRTLHSTLHAPHFTLNTQHFKHSTLYTPHCPLYTLHFIFCTPHFTLYTWHLTLLTLHFTLHTHTLVSLYTPHSTLYALH